jgi:flagellin
LTGAIDLGDFTLVDENGNAVTLASNTAGVAGDRAGFFSGTASGFRSLAEMDLSSQSGASAAIRIADAALNSIIGAQTNFGVAQNALSYVIDNASTLVQSTTEAFSGVVDADYAVESAKLAKAQILQEASTAMISTSVANMKLVSKLIESF